MKKIKIEIPDGLTPQQEILKIAKHLQNSMLGAGDQPKRIGQQPVDIEHLQTTIVVTRKPSEKTAIGCQVCGILFNKRDGKKAFTNYGGTIKPRFFCSDKCRDQYISINPERIKATKKEFKPVCFR